MAHYSSPDDWTLFHISNRAGEYTFKNAHTRCAVDSKSSSLSKSTSTIDFLLSPPPPFSLRVLRSRTSQNDYRDDDRHLQSVLVPKEKTSA